VTYLSACAIFRDEADYLEEWIEFHRLVGVERFLLYDNGSVDDSRKVLARYARDDTVQVHDWPGPQYAAYDDCLARHGAESRWIAFIDLDEFLFSPAGASVPEMLERYERWSAVGVHWCVFGGSGWHQKPDGLVIESYKDHTTDPILNRWVKSIVDPSRTMRCLSSHAFRHRADRRRAYAVDEQERLLNGSNPGWSNDISFDLLRINHYWTKSREEWERKLARPDAMHGGDRRFAALRWDQVQVMLSEARDDAITAYVPKLREALGLPATGSASAT